jgi:hypothetical protein
LWIYDGDYRVSMGFVYGDIMGIMVFLWGLFVDISYGDNHVSMGFVCGHIMGIIVFLWDLFVDI